MYAALQSARGDGRLSWLCSALRVTPLASVLPRPKCDLTAPNTDDVKSLIVRSKGILALRVTALHVPVLVHT